MDVGHVAEARITRIVIQTRTSPAFGGASFGLVGQYEQLTGVAFGEVNPKDPLNAVITDIELAPRNTRGNVEYSMDFSITKPLDMTRGNGTLLYDETFTSYEMKRLFRPAPPQSDKLRGEWQLSFRIANSSVISTGLLRCRERLS